MSQITVEYVDHMGQDITVSNVARVSFNKWREEFESGDAKLINYLADHGHSSPFRHPQIQLRCSVPIFIARQLQKHTVGLTWNEVSRRYVDSDIEFFVPDSWRSRPDASIKQGSGQDTVEELSWDGGEPIHTAYKDSICAAMNLYDRMIDDGVAPEMARMVLPQSMMTSFIWTGSLAAFFHVYKLRSEEHAQLEVQEFATQLEAVIQPLFPVSWSALKGEHHDIATN